ncbi:MAG: DUF2779 domain-containing protein [Limisphaerales bacterium]
MTANTATPSISKSKFLWGQQCHKLLWHAYNAKHLIPEPDASQQAVFDQGHEVGALAKQMFPNGVEVGQGVTDYGETIRLTKRALKLRRPLFEAAFAANGGYCRVDILAPAPDGAWDLVEVKSTTAAKDVHLPDLAFQTWVLATAGLKIRRCLLMHINGNFVRSGPVNPKQFFTLVDLTDPVANLAQTVEDSLDDMASVIRRKQEPEINIGSHCDDPYTCPLHDHCWSFLPSENVTTLYRGKAKGFKLLADGIHRINDIPAGFPLTENQEIQRRVAVTGQPHVSKPAIQAFLRQLEYPISYLDFESFNSAIPLFDNTSPFEQVPFQFSLHIVRSPDSQPEHRMFLADGRADPRLEFLQRLRDWLPDTGSIIVYNQQFEQSRLRECCRLHPQFQTWLDGVEARFVDLLKPFRAFRWYGPSQSGSASMKVVLPALTGLSYDHLEIKEGGSASLEYVRVHFTDVSESERQRVRQNLERYCSLDTEAMLHIVRALKKLVSE